MVLPTLSLWASLGHFQPILFGTLALSILHLYPAVRLKAAQLQGRLLQRAAPLLVGGTALAVGGLALVAVGLRHPLPYAVLLLPIGGAYLPYGLMCVYDAVAETDSGARDGGK